MLVHVLPALAALCGEALGNVAAQLAATGRPVAAPDDVIAVEGDTKASLHGVDSNRPMDTDGSIPAQLPSSLHPGTGDVRVGRGTAGEKIEIEGKAGCIAAGQSIAIHRGYELIAAHAAGECLRPGHGEQDCDHRAASNEIKHEYAPCLVHGDDRLHRQA